MAGSSNEEADRREEGDQARAGKTCGGTEFRHHTLASLDGSALSSRRGADARLHEEPAKCDRAERPPEVRAANDAGNRRLSCDSP